MLLQYPPNSRLINQSDESLDGTVGKYSVPLFLSMKAYAFSNLPKDRANFTGESLLEVRLPLPNSTTSSTNIEYNQELAKEAGAIAKIFTETGNLATNLLNLPGRILFDQFQNLSGVDSGRRPMEATEITFLSAKKRNYSFSWVLTAIDEDESDKLVEIADAMSAYSLPSSAPSSTRMIAPPMWKLSILAGGVEGENGSLVGTSSSDLDKVYLSSPKACVCLGVSVDRDSSALYTTGSTRKPISLSITTTFLEIDPILRSSDSTTFISRSELRS